MATGAETFVADKTGTKKTPRTEIAKVRTSTVLISENNPVRMVKITVKRATMAEVTTVDPIAQGMTGNLNALEARVIEAKAMVDRLPHLTTGTASKEVTEIPTTDRG